MDFNNDIKECGRAVLGYSENVENVTGRFQCNAITIIGITDNKVGIGINASVDKETTGDVCVFFHVHTLFKGRCSVIENTGLCNNGSAYIDISTNGNIFRNIEDTGYISVSKIACSDNCKHSFKFGITCKCGCTGNDKISTYINITTNGNICCYINITCKCGGTIYYKIRCYINITANGKICCYINITCKCGGTGNGKISTYINITCNGKISCYV